MAKQHLSLKHIQVNKATTTMVVLIAVSVAILMFCLLATRALLSQRSYYAKVITRKEAAKKQLEANVKAKDELVTAYQAFVAQPQNIIGGNSTGQGQNDGDNGRIILDALPSKYDFPALATSLEKLLADPTLGVALTSLTGSDDEIAQNEAVVEAPEPVEIPIQIELAGSYGSVRSAIVAIERSIRPIKIQSLSLGGSDTEMTVQVNALTYYQPEKKVNIKIEDIQ